jgi:hypothetical protein
MTPRDATTVVIDKDAAMCVCAVVSRGDDNLSRMCGRIAQKYSIVPAVAKVCENFSSPPVA